MSYFTYNGRSSEEFKLHIESKNVFSAPEYDVEFQSIPGRNGDLIISNNRFSNVKISYTVFLARKTVSDLSKTLKEIKGWLYSEPDRYHKITDSYDKNYIRYGVINQNLEIEEQLNRVGVFTVTFNCKPFRYSLEGLSPVVIENGGKILNPELFPSFPVIEIKGSGDFSLTVQNKDFNKTWNFKDIEKGVTCDSEQMNFYWETELLNHKVTGEDFPTLNSGETFISTIGNVEQITVTPRWCCL